MAFDTFKYPSEWTESYNSYVVHRKEICHKIIQYMENYEKFLPNLNKQVDLLKEHFFSCSNLLNQLK